MPLSTTSSSQNHEFAVKVAFITGAGSGIGRATEVSTLSRPAKDAANADTARGVVPRAQYVCGKRISSAWSQTGPNGSGIFVW
jgi:hypothetical protein